MNTKNNMSPNEALSKSNPYQSSQETLPRQNAKQSSEEKQLKRKTFLQKRIVVFFGAMICCALWGSAFPCVKIGMKLFAIRPDQTADQILFASCRFALAGILVIIVGSLLKKKSLIPKKQELPSILWLCLFQTVGQYFFYYIGIAHTSGVNTSIVDSLSIFLSILSASLLFRMEKLTGRKILGCILGFLGVVLVNLNGGGFNFHMTWIGEGMILCSAITYSFSSIFAKIFSRKSDPVLLSGWQFLIGGLILSVGAMLAGARPKSLTPGSFLLFLYLAFISMAAYTIWTILLKYNDVSLVSVYGFMNPVFGVLLSALFLGETEGLNWNYLLSLIFIAIGINLVNRQAKRNVNQTAEVTSQNTK